MIGTVVIDDGDGYTNVRLDNDTHEDVVLTYTGSLNFIIPAEPPVGSVVAFEGIAWTRYEDEPYPWRCHAGGTRSWAQISNGEIVFTKGSPV
jgi:hypothetical protein